MEMIMAEINEGFFEKLSENDFTVTGDFSPFGGYVETIYEKNNIQIIECPECYDYPYQIQDIKIEGKSIFTIYPELKDKILDEYCGTDREKHIDMKTMTHFDVDYNNSLLNKYLIEKPEWFSEVFTELKARDIDLLAMLEEEE